MSIRTTFLPHAPAVLIVAAMFCLQGTALGEGSLQVGLNQPLLEYGYTSALITNGARPIHVDLLAAGEVINISLCGDADADDVRAEIYGPGGGQVLAQTLTSGNVSCASPFTAPLTNPIRYVSAAAGTYEVRLINVQAGGEVLRRFDVTVTPNSGVDPNPGAAQGRVWSRDWAFNTASYAEALSTDADYFVLVPGGRPNTNYVWLLDLNNFAGFVYDIVANDIGVDGANAGLSVPRAGNSVSEKYPQYLSYPAGAQPPPLTPPQLTDVRFIDNLGIDNGISPGSTNGIQDSGSFEFTTDVNGTYAIVIDINRNQVFGAGDRLLLGTAVPGSNSVFWDGYDNAGAPLPDGLYNARVQIRLGEYHFVANDAETSGGTQPGLTLFQALSGGGTSNTQVYWDDATILGGTTTLPDGSPAARHTWGSFTSTSFGNNRYIDTYTFGLVSEVTRPVVIDSADTALVDRDGDGVPDSIDIDDDDDGILDTVEGNGDLDADTRPDYLDVDADGDGIPDTIEAQSSAGFRAPANTDADLDGLDDAYDTTQGGIALVPIDTDADALPDYRDLDTDGDGVPDAIEGHDADHDGVADTSRSGADADADGLDNAYDTLPAPAPANPLASNAPLQDTDADAAPDWRDTDDDGDGYSTFDEDWDGSLDRSDDDADGDGVPDYLDPDSPIDADGDGLADVSDLDDDNDGIPDSVEGPGDRDGDGVPDALDLDSDHDGIPDLREAGGTDADADGRVDGFTDGNGDGLDDAIAASPLPRPDTDADTRPDYLDVDADGDGIPDTIEAQSSAGFRAPANTDADLDGLDDAYDTTQGGIALVPIDTDADALPDYRDLDTDGDGVPDAIEGHDADHDGVADTSRSGADADADGLDNAYDTLPAPAPANPLASNAPLQDTDADAAPDWRDTDDDGDGYSTFDEDWDGSLDRSDDDADGDGVPDYLDPDSPIDADGDGLADVSDLDDDNDGIPDSVEGPGDRDGDGVPDALDLDSDHDGIPDLREAGGTDADADGRVDGFTDGNGDGLDDAIAASPLPRPDTDADTRPDYLDVDADGDGIPDTIEAQSSAGFRAPANTDADLDGLDDAYDTTQGGIALVPIDTDADALPDYRDLDTDGDGVPDAIEGHDADHDGVADTSRSGADADADGLDNAYDTLPAPAPANPLASNAPLQDTDADAAPDWRDTDDDGDGYSTFDEDWDGSLDRSDDDADGDGVPDYLDPDSPIDADGDGLADVSDLDDDNDGIPDSVEGPGDRDGDGVPDALDLDSDHDGIPDLREAGGTDADADGRVDGFTDGNGDGLDDAIAASPLPRPDTDADTRPDYLDVDADGDGIPDTIEAQSSAGFRAPANTDADLDGLDDAYDTTQGGTALVPIDTDADALPDYRDLDTDGDGVPDAIEGHDADHDGVADTSRSGADADADGLDNAYDTLPAPAPANPLASNAPLQDTDADAAPDWRDTDDDGDGLPTATEDLNSNGDPTDDDEDADGRPDYLDGPDNDGDGLSDGDDEDDDNDGIPDLIEGALDSDGDGLPDRFDVDSDDDGIPDVREAQTTAGFIAPSRIDLDGDGLDDAYDVDRGGTPLTPIDTDTDSVPDYLDDDTDEDGVPDRIEGHDADHDGVADTTPTGVDGDGDGLDDAYDTTTAPAAGNEDGSNAPLQDTDGSGEPDWRDIDDDDDGIATAGEDINGNLDWSDDDDDSDGVPDYLDTSIPTGGAIVVTKQVGTATARIGDLVSYVVTAENVGTTPLVGLTLSDTIPAGFKYVAGSGRLTRAGVDGDLGTPDDAATAVEPAGSRPIAFEALDFGPGELLQVTYLLRVGTGVIDSDYVNRVTPLVGGSAIGNTATATVSVLNDDPILARTTIIGKVFHDLDGDGVQGEGEHGIPGVRVATATGLLIETDPAGRYHVADVDGGRFERGRNVILKVDPATLPAGSRFTTENPRVLHLTQSLMDKINFGVRLPAGNDGRAADPSSAETVRTIEAAASPANAATILAVKRSADVATEEAPGDDRAAIAEESRLDLAGGGTLWVTEDPGVIDPRLEVVAPIRVEVRAGKLRSAVPFGLYSNYGKFIARWELSIHDGRDEDLVEELHRITGRGPLGATQLEWDGELGGKRLQIGDELLYVLRVFDADGHLDETAAKRIALVDRLSDAGEPDRDDAMLRSAYGSSSLMRQTIPLRGSRVRVHGAGLAGGSVLNVEGHAVPVDASGRVALELMLPLGGHGMDIACSARDGGRERHRIPVVVSGRYFFMVGLADLTLGQNDVSGSVEPLSGDERFDGSTFTDGRIAFYLKGKVKGRYLITAQLDTQEEDLGQILDGLDDEDPRSIFRRLDPDLYYPIYGDGSTTESDVNTQGRFYVRLDWDQSLAQWGNFDTGMTGTEFAQYNRSLYGAKLEHRTVATTESGEHRAEIVAFASQARSALAHDEFVGTGGSLYYLQHRDILQGSEKARVEIRDRDSTRVIESLTLERGRDYEMDEIQGRIVLTRPLMQVAEQVSPSIIRDTPLDGNDVRLLVDYEYVPSGFDPDQMTLGARAKGWVTDRLAFGGSYVNESRPGEDHELVGADLTYRAGRGTYVKAEYADSTSTQADSSRFSTDGGLTFAEIVTTGALAEPREGSALAFEGRINFAELLDGTDASAAAWWRQRDAGFSTARSDTSHETTEYGVEGIWRQSERLRLATRASVIDRDGLQQDRAIGVQADVSATERLSVGAELRDVRQPTDVSAAAATLGAVRVGYEFHEDVTGYLTGQFMVRQDDDYPDNNLGSVGVRARVAENWEVRAEGGTGDRGNALQLGAEYQAGPTQQLYGTYTLSPDRNDGRRGSMTAGRRAQLSNQLQIFNETQFSHGDRQAGLTHVFGLDIAPREPWKVGISVQSSDLEDAATGGIERDAASVSLGYSGGAARYSGKLEWRDDGGSVDRTQWLTSNLFDVRLREGLSMLGKLNLSKTEDGTSGPAEGKFVEGSVGLAYRPLAHDRLNLLGSATLLYDLPSAGQATARADQRSNVLSLEGLYDVSRRWGLGAKLAIREGELRLERGAGEWFSSDAKIRVLRARYHMLHEWDGVAEYRVLSSDDAEDDKSGFLLVAYKQVQEHFKVGVGYNFTDFDDDLTEVGYESRGWFVKLLGKL